MHPQEIQLVFRGATTLLLTKAGERAYQESIADRAKNEAFREQLERQRVLV